MVSLNVFSGQEFVELYNSLDVERINEELSQQIFENKDVDDYVKAFAESLGYQKRSFIDQNELVDFSGIQTLPEIRDAYVALRNEMLEDDIGLHLVSGYRGFEGQKNIFFKKLGIANTDDIPSGVYDKELGIVLERSALPGYSKHHSAYAVDFGCGNKYLVFEFAETECYQWMSQNNFEPIKKHGFVPSYPEDVSYQGPNPEPWEYVWVGMEQLR